MSRLKIVETSFVTLNKFHTEDPQILGASVKVFIYHCDMVPGICAALLNEKGPRPSQSQSHCHGNL